MAKQTAEITKATKLAVFEIYRGCCAGCGIADSDLLQYDHVQPRAFFVARKMPVDNSVKNVQLLCAACNNLKNDVEYMGKLPPRQPEDSVMQCKINRVAFKRLIDTFRAEDRKRNSLWAD